MNWLVAVAAVITAADVPQRVHLLRRATVLERRVVAAGFVAAALVLAFIATPVLDAADVSGPTLEIGAGIILGLWSFVAAVRWDDRPPPPSEAGSLVPLLFPIVLTPPVGTVIAAVAARNGWWLPVLATAICATTLVVPRVGAPLARRSARAISAAGGIVVAVAMIVDGTYSV